MTSKILRLVFVLACLCGSASAFAAWKDIKIDLTNGNLLTQEEKDSKSLVKFDCLIADDGTVTRVAAGEGNITLTGKYHSDEHGWGNFSSTVAVEGPVKISMGSCAWGGDVNVTNAAGENVAKFNTNTGACYHQDKNTNIASTIYRGEATTLTIAGGSYTPYIAVESVNPADLKEEVVITFEVDAADGIAPEAVTVEMGKTVEVPANFTVYREGNTLTGWTDGTKTWLVGEVIEATANMTLKPVFVANTVSVADRTEALALRWDFQRKNGAPSVGWQGKDDCLWVTQAKLGTEVIDVVLRFSTKDGKFANGNWNDWCQINSGTSFKVPSCKGATISLESYSPTTTTTIDGKKMNESGANPAVYTVAGEAGTVDLVIGDGSYFRYIAAELPVVAASSWKDIKIDLTNANLLTEEEKASKSMVKFDCLVAADGTVSRVAAGEGNITLTGKYHSDEHGWGNFSSTVAVEGPVKISMGSCAWGGDVNVTNAAGENVAKFNTNTGACYHQDKNTNIASTIYKGEATTLTISGGSYTPYIAVESVDPADLKEDVVLTFEVDAADGIAPEALTVEMGKTVEVPANFTVYREGNTLTGWTDGTKTWLMGEVIEATANMTLKPVFVANAVNLADRKEAVTVRWDFQRKNGAPSVGWQNIENCIWVAQAKVGTEVIDVALRFSTQPGKFANGNWNDWCQINEGTSFKVPSCKGATISLESYSATKTTTIDGVVMNESGANPAVFTVGSEAETVDLVIGDGSYFRYIAAELPYVKPSDAGTVYENKASAVAWAFNSNDYASVTSVEPENGFSTTAFDLNGNIFKGTTSSVVEPEVTYVKIEPVTGSGDEVKWYVKPVKGLTFTPTKVHAYIGRAGTDVSNGLNVYVNAEGGEKILLGNYTAHRVNKVQAEDKFGGNDNYATHFDIELTPAQQAELASADGFYFSMNIGVNSGKQGAFSDIRIEGLLNGTIEAVEKYAVTAVASPAEAATVTIYPASESYEKGSEVTLTAKKNFGYAFVNWTDAEGAVVSEKEKFVYTVNAPAALTANFVKLNTYQLKIAIEGGANSYMVQPQPAPTMIDAKMMYEEGTTVTLAASSNPIFTFTNWGDGSSSSEMSVKMDADKDITATYSAVDFVVGWDFYLPGNDSRTADFAAADNDAVALVMRDAEGNLSGWLDKCQSTQGGYEGRPAGVCWRVGERDGDVGNWYWQTKINAAAFTNLRVQGAMVYNYNAHTAYNVDASLDGEAWTNVGVINLEGAKNWADYTFDLPATFDNKQEVYIRWIADKNSPVDGTASKNDGAAIGGTYIFGSEKLINDGTAPVLVSFVPAEGSNTASINGKVILNFDEKVKMAKDAKAILKGETESTLEGTVSGKTVMFAYKNLNYASDYTFTLPANSVGDLTDNMYAKPVVINFTTKTRPAVEKAMYDFVVPDDGTFKEAIAAANGRADKDKRYRIFVKKGSYLLPYDEKSMITNNGVSLPASITKLIAPNTSIIGEDREATVIKNDLKDLTEEGVAYPIEGLGNVTTLWIDNEAKSTYMQDITLKNGLNDATGRGEALRDQGDKTIAKNVTLWGYQDTYCSNNENMRAYFEGGVLRGRTDYLCGKGTIYYNGVTLQNTGTGGYIAVPSNSGQFGYVFKDCEIVGESPENNGNYYLGRPWGKGSPIAVFIDTKMTSQPRAAGWNEMGDGWPKRFAEYNSVTAQGTPIDLSDRKVYFYKDDACVNENNPNVPVLTKEEAYETFSYSNVCAGTDDWDPASIAEFAPAPANVKIDMKSGELTWDDSQYVSLWAVCVDGKVKFFTLEPKAEIDAATLAGLSGANAVTVRSANEMGGLGEAVVASDLSGIIDVESADAVVSSVYYNMQGMQVSADTKGVVLRVDTLASGATRTVKTVEK